MKKLLAVILCVVCLGCGEKKNPGIYAHITRYEIGAEATFVKHNKETLKKIIEEYKATHTKCDYCEKEFLTADLKEFTCDEQSNMGTYYTKKYICPTCKADFKAECESMTEKATLKEGSTLGISLAFAQVMKEPTFTVYVPCDEKKEVVVGQWWRAKEYPTSLIEILRVDYTGVSYAIMTELGEHVGGNHNNSIKDFQDKYNFINDDRVEK